MENNLASSSGRNGEVNFGQAIDLIKWAEANLKKAIDKTVWATDTVAINKFLVEAHLESWK